MPTPDLDQAWTETSDERVSVVITLKEQPDSPSDSEEKANLRAQEDLITSWETDHSFEVDRQFGYLFNGVSGTLPLSQIAPLSLDPRVQSVRRERLYEPVEHTARDLHGVPQAFGEHNVDGTGMVISIIDSGLDPSHQDMRLDDCSAAAIQTINPEPEGGFTCKVPTGYNYADENFQVKESQTSSHGMHVGGITAANGSDGDTPGDVAQTGRIDGIAPNAQLLAMRVFSEAGGGAQDSDIIAAIEDSVKLGADVINMSLGSPNGLKSDSDGTAIAIQKAREAGVLTVIAAGNSGQNFSVSGGPDDVFGFHDDGTVSSPGVLGDALTVASVNNSKLTQSLAFYGDPEQAIYYQMATGIPDEQSHPIVDLGLGTEAEVAGQNLNGAYALLERGQISFAEKYQNAINAGAGGIVIFNSAAGGDTYFGMAGIDGFTIPGIVVTRTNGLAIRQQIAAGGTQIRITNEVSVEDNPVGMEPSDFTSWGSTPTLDFEPEIAGIGGGVYSTYNDDSYGNSSGTSMASPNVAGLATLLLEDLKRTRPELSGAARVDAAKILLMNTAVVPVNSAKVPYSPRQIGAGLAQVDRALATPVMATVDGKGAAELREVQGSASFTVTLENFSSEDHTYTIPANQSVVAETNEPGQATLTRISGGSIATSASTVTVPAGGSTTVEVTVTPEAGADHFMGGWVVFEADADNEVNLRIPFLGFAGDWNQEPIVLPPGDVLDPNLPLESVLLTKWGGMTLPASALPNGVWLSPNGDGDMDIVAPSVPVMRNASDIEYQILDANGDVVKVLGQEQDVRRTTLSNYLSMDNPLEGQWTGANFDGQTWDAQQSDFTVMPDGQYTYRVRTRLGEAHPWQNTDFSFGIDATAPTIEFGGPVNGLLSITVTEEGSGILAPPTVTDPAGKELPVTKVSDTEYTVPVDPDVTPYVTAAVVDGGFNLATATKVLATGRLIIANADKLQADVLGPSLTIVNDELRLTGYTSDDIVKIRVNGGEDIDVTNGRFTAMVKLAQGENRIVVEALDDAGAVVATEELVVRYDSTAPELALTNDPRNDAGEVEFAGNLELDGKVTDERADAPLSLTAVIGKDKVDVPLAADGSFSLNLPVPDGTKVVVLVASDGLNETKETFWAVGAAGTRPGALYPEVTNADCLFEMGACFIPGGTPEDLSADRDAYTLRGKVAPGTGSITFTPGSRVSDDGSYTKPQPIEATIADDGTFSLELPLTTGKNQFRMVITSTAGEVMVDRAMSVFFDVTAPTLKVEEPTLVDGTLHTNSSTVRLRGTAEDDGWGYRFMINDSVVVERMDLSTTDPNANRRDFDTEFTVSDGDTILVVFSDKNENILMGLIPVVLDDQAPEISIENVTDGEVITDRRVIDVTAEDENLASLTVALNGDVVADEATDITALEHPFEGALVDVSDLVGTDDEDDASEASDQQPAAPENEQQSAPVTEEHGTDAEVDATEQGSEPTDANDHQVSETEVSESETGETEAAEDEADAAQDVAEDAKATPESEQEPADTPEDDDPVEAPAPANNQLDQLDPKVTAAEPAQTTLNAAIDTSELAPGTYHLDVNSRDLAGNVSTESLEFTVEWELEIDGPDSVDLTVSPEQLMNQEELAKSVLAEYTALLNGSPDEAAKAGATLELAPNTVLTEGTQKVTIIATDDEGRVSEREITVTIKVSKNTGGDDSGDDGDGSGGGSGDGSGSGSRDGSRGGPDDGSQGGSTKGGSGDGSGSSKQKQGVLARTGVEIGGAIAAIVVLIGSGALVLALRKRSK